MVNLRFIKKTSGRVMYSIVICVPTYKRPLMLEKLIQSIANCNMDKSLIHELNIVIIDNDIKKTAEKTVYRLKDKYYSEINIFYYSLPEKGLSNIRNELIKKSLIFMPDFIVFIDDDEYADSKWLNELLTTIITNDADMAMGPVIPVFDNIVSSSISYWFKRQHFNNNSRIDAVATNNLIIRMDSLQKYNVWFDSRFNKTGGEDSYFGKIMIKKGAKAYWSRNAIVYETISKNRSNIHWLIRRYYNGANNYTYILKIDRDYSKLIIKILVSIFYILIGAFLFLLILFPIKKKYWGLLKIAEGAGGIAALFSLRYNEYK